MKTVIRMVKNNFFGFEALVVSYIVQEKTPEEVADAIIKNNPNKELEKVLKDNGEVELLLNDKKVYDLAFS